MAKIFVTARDGAETELEGKAGLTVMEIVRARFPDDLLALCGGGCSCATCHVYVDPAFAGRFPPQGDIENELLDMSDNRRPSSRLSCQLPFSDMVDGLKVIIAPDE